MRVAMIGLGYVGLVTSACLAEQGHAVIGVEVGPERIKTLLEGRMPFHEPGLTELVAGNRRRGRLTFTSDPSAVVDADIVFIAVGTHDGNGGWQTGDDPVLPGPDRAAVWTTRRSWSFARRSRRCSSATCRGSSAGFARRPAGPMCPCS